MTEGLNNCVVKTVTGSIELSADHQINLDTANKDQSICENTAIATITYTLSEGATGFVNPPTWTSGGVPVTLTGVNITLVGSQVVIAGTPTLNVTTDTTYIYSIVTAGTTGFAAASCGAKTVTGSIELLADHQISLFSGSNDQSICENTAIATITYTLSEGATSFVTPPNWTSGGVPSTLTGVNITLVGSKVVIAGTPITNVTTDTTYIYTILTKGLNNCAFETVTGSITLSADHEISLATANDNQSVCTNNAITPITYTLGGGAENISASITPFTPGLSIFTTIGNQTTLSGTPTLSVTTPTVLIYTIITRGTQIQPNVYCNSKTVTGTITILPDHDLSLKSGQLSQTYCVGTNLDPIEIDMLGGTTSYTIAYNLALNLTHTISGSVITIGGSTPSFVTTDTSYTVTLTSTGNSCVTDTITATINVVLAPTLSLTSSVSTEDQSVCNKTSIATITYKMDNGVSTYFLSGQPNGIVPTETNGVITISGKPDVAVTVPTSYRYKLVTTNSTSCADVSQYGFIVVKPESILNIKNQAATVRSITREVCAEQFFNPIVIEFSGFYRPRLLAGSSLPSGINSPTIAITQQQESSVVVSGTSITASQTFYVSVFLVNNGANAQFSYTTIAPNENATTIAQGLLNSMAGSTVVSSTLNGSTIEMIAQDNEDLFEVRMYSSPESNLLTPGISLPLRGELTLTGTPTASVTSGTFIANVGEDSSDYCIDDQIVVTLEVEGVSFINIINPAEADLDICDNTSHLINFEYGGTATGAFESDVVWKNNLEPSAFSMTSSGTTVSGTTLFELSVTASENVTTTTTYEYTIITSGSDCEEGSFTGEINVFPSEYIAHIATTTSFTGTSAFPQGDEIQVICDGNPIAAPIKYEFWGSSDSYTLTWGGLGAVPLGVVLVPGAGTTSGSFTITISGTLNTGVTTTTIYTYTIATVGSNLGGPNCDSFSRVGSLEVRPLSRMSLFSPGLDQQTGNNAICNRSDILDITYLIGGGAIDVNIPPSTVGASTINFSKNFNIATGQIVIGATVNTTVTQTTTFPYTITTINQFTCAPEVTLAGQIEVYPDVVVNQAFITANDISDVTCFGASDGSIIIPQTPLSEFEKRIVGGQQNIRQIDQLSLLSSATLNAGDVVQVTINGAVFQGVVPVGATTSTILQELLVKINSNNPADVPVKATIVSGTLLNLIADVGGVPFTSAGQTITSSVTGTTLITNITPNKTISYSFNWTGPNGFTSTALNINNLDSGDYTLAVTANGCSSDPPTYDFTVGGPVAALALDVIGCSGTMNVTPSGGNAPYVISVYQVGLTTNTLLQVQPTNGAIQFNGLTAGQNYIIQLLDSTCAISEDLAYKMPFDILIDPSKVTLTHDVCNESPTNLGGGSIVLSNNTPVTGGSGNYSYQWAGVTNAGVTNVYTSQDITNILPGSYTLTVTDLELGCTSNKTFNILTPTAVTTGPTNQTSLMETNWYPSFATATATTVTGTIDALILLNCQQDFADMEVQIIGNGTNGNSAVISTTVIGTYAVNWLKNGSAMTALNPRFKIEDQGPGVYEARVSLTGVGIANCTVDTYRFEVRKAEVLTAVEVVNERIEAPCSGNFASLTFQVSGGSSVGGQYTISLNNGLYVTSSNSTTIVIPQIDPLELNTIDTITISDNSGCDPVTEDIADIILSIPEDVEIDVAQIVDVDCLNDQLGSITLGVTKGTFNDVGQIQVIWKSDLTDPTKAGSTQFLNWDMTGVTDNKGLAVANGTLPDIKFAGKYAYEVKLGNASNTCILAAGEVDVVSQDLSQLTLSEVIITQPGCAATLGRIDLVIDVNTIIGGLEIVWEEFVTDLSVSATGTTTTASTTTSSNTTTQIWKEITGFKNQTAATDLPNGVYRAIISDDRGISLNANCPSGPIRTNSISIANTGIQISNLALTEIVPADCTNLADITTTLQFSISSNLPNPGANQHFFEYNILGDKLGSIAHSVNGNAAGIIVVPPNTWDGKYTITGLLPDRYTLSVSEQTTAAASGTAAVLCEDFYSFEINEFTPMTYAGDTSFVIDPCSDEVEITANITGGVPFSINGSLVYDYQWTLRPTLADGTPSGLERNYIGKSITLTEEGSLELKVTDSRGCYIEPTSALNLGNFTIAFENRALQITPELSTSSSTLAIDKVYSIPPTCNGGVPNGQIAFTINEGAAPYDIIWMKQIAGTTASSTTAGYQEILEYKGTESQNGLESGDYRIIVRSQDQPCGNTPSTYLEKDISVEQNKDLYFLTDPVVNSDLCLSLPGQIIVQLYDNQKGAVSFFYGTEKLVSQTDDNETYIVDVPNPVISETLYVRNSADCEISQKINIGVGSPTFSINSISLSQSKPILAREEITFENNSTEPWVIEKWIFGDNSPAITRDRRTDPIDPIRKSYGIAGTFFATLRISNAIGCDVEITKPIVVGVGYSILMPNVFTPNDDGDNEAFKPIFSGLKSMDFTVYDSRGNLLWTKSYEEAIPGNGMDEIEDDDGFQGLDGNGSPYYIYTISGKSLFGDIDIDKSGTFIIIK
ncbi:gliding motility-associated C-terminal domain-containing protein [Flavobacteriaceae bacterium]|nr:gliding motility-associated C-terminal domain-containing protein [Flavobacteriaceae bacterium]